MTWLGATPGPVAILISGALLAHYVLVEPWWGKVTFSRLARRRPHEPGALLAFYRLTVGMQGAAVGAVVLAVLLDPGIGAASIGLAFPSAPLGDLLPVIVGIALAGGAGLVLGLRAAWNGTSLPIAPAAIAPLIPVTRTEKWWAAAVSIGAGVSEELVFRGLLLAVAVGVGLPPVLAAAMLTVVFGAAHLYQGVGGLVLALLLGALMSSIALGTGSLLVPMVLHAAVDLRALLLTRPAEMPAWLARDEPAVE